MNLANGQAHQGRWTSSRQTASEWGI